MLLVASLAVGASSVSALSCAEPEHFDMEATIAQADGAAVGTITSISQGNKNDWDEFDLVLTVQVSEVYKGSAPPTLYLERFPTVWGPFYEEGQELAMLITNDSVSDGQEALCGPWFSADDMRQAGGEPSIAVGEPYPPPQPAPWNFFGFLSGLFDFFRFILTF